MSDAADPRYLGQSARELPQHGPAPGGGDTAAAGVSLDVYDELREIPPYDADLEVEPADPAVLRFREAIARADGVLIATPEYNGSIPGVLKNTLDWASRPFPTTRFAGSRSR